MLPITAFCKWQNLIIMQYETSNDGERLPDSWVHWLSWPATNLNNIIIVFSLTSAQRNWWSSSYFLSHPFLDLDWCLGLVSLIRMRTGLYLMILFCLLSVNLLLYLSSPSSPQHVCICSTLQFGSDVDFLLPFPYWQRRVLPSSYLLTFISHSFHISGSIHPPASLNSQPKVGKQAC